MVVGDADEPDAPLWPPAVLMSTSSLIGKLLAYGDQAVKLGTHEV